MIKKKEVKLGCFFRRPTGDIVIVFKIEKDGFYYHDKNNIAIGGWHSFKDGKYLKK